jgi:hypothetical protein
MPAIPIGDNSIGYDTCNLLLTSDENERYLLTRQLNFAITGGVYQGISGSTSIIESTTDGSTSGPKLYLRNMSLYSGTTANDFYILTDTQGNGNTTFKINKGEVPITGLTGPYALLYSRNLTSYKTGTDHTEPVFLLFPQTKIEAGSVFSVRNQSLTKTGATAGTLSLNNVFYDGITASGNNGIILAYISPSIVGLSGTTASVTGSFLGSTDLLDYNGNTNINIKHDTTFDTTIPNNYYLTYYLKGSTGITAGDSYNYVGMTGVNLPFSSSIEYRTSLQGVTANLYNLNYDFVGLTAGNQIYFKDNQKGTTSILTVNLTSTGVPYTSYFFGPTGGTSIVLSGSQARFYNGTTASNNFFALPAHLSGSEGITGKIEVNYSIFTNKKVTASLKDFNYYDIDRNSIFNYFDNSGHTGIVYLVSEDGYTGSSFSGLTGIPFIGSTAGVVFTNLGNENVEFPTGLTNGPETKYYNTSFYDYSLNQLKGSTALISYNWPGRIIYDEELFVNNNISKATISSLLINVAGFDYYDKYQDAVLSDGHTGIIYLKDSSSGITLGSFNYNGVYDPLGVTERYIQKFTNITFEDGETKLFKFLLSDPDLRPANKLFSVRALPEKFIGEAVNSPFK